MTATQPPLSAERIAEQNAPHLDDLYRDYDHLSRQLERRGVDAAAVLARVADFAVAIPTWGAGRGGTRFARFPIPGEPTDIHEKLEDCAVVQQLSTVTPRVSPHFPWDRVDDYAGLQQKAERNPREGFDPACMIDRSHNVTDPIESLLSSAEAIVQCYAKALLVDRAALHAAQDGGDTMMAFQTLRRAYTVDVSPIVAKARVAAGGAYDVLAAYRASGWRARKAQTRRPVGLGAGIV